MLVGFFGFAGMAYCMLDPRARQAAEQLVKEHMARYDPSHDWAHVDRVRNVALRIAASLDGVDIAVVELAALFHDLTGKYSPTKGFEETIQPFLKDNSVPAVLKPAQIALMSRIVPAVSWSTEEKLRSGHGWTDWHETCLELHAVQDADRLDAIGAIGVLRCAAYSGAKGVTLLAESGASGASAEGHFDDKLFKIRDRLKVSETHPSTSWAKLRQQTPLGRSIAESRHQTMLIWMASLQEEKAMSAPIGS